MPNSPQSRIPAIKESIRRQRVKEREARLPRDNGARKVGRCGAKTKTGTTCRQPAGGGTDHFGIGKCKHHGGNLPTHKLNAVKQEAQFMGAPKDINPIDAIMWCIRLTAGEVEFCTEQMQSLEENDWIEHTIVGKQLHMWAKERQNAVDRLARFAKDAIALGIAERSVRVAEMYGHSIAKLVRGILEDLELTGDQLERAPHIVRKHLVLLEGKRPLTDEERERPALMPARVRLLPDEDIIDV